MKIGLIVAICLAACVACVSPASAGPIFDFVATSLTSPTTDVSGYIQFDGHGYSWDHVDDAQLAINGVEEMEPFVGRSQGMFYDKFGTIDYFLSANFIRLGNYVVADYFSADFANTLLLSESGLIGDDGYFSTDHPTACYNDCTFSGYFELRPGTDVPEPSTIWVLIGGLAMFLAVGSRMSFRDNTETNPGRGYP